MIKFIYSAISKLDMKGKRGIEFNLATIAVAILILIGLILVVVYTLSGFTKLTGSEGIGKAQTEARAGLLGVDWDALTSKEQKAIEKKDPKDAAEIQLNTAQTAIISEDYDNAIILAKRVASNPPTDDLKKRADEIIAKAEAGKKLLAGKNKIIEEQKAKISESEKKIDGFETYKKRFNELLTQESIAIKEDIGKESLVDQLVYKTATGGFN